MKWKILLPPRRIETGPCTWFTGKDKVFRIEPGNLFNTSNTASNWSKNFICYIPRLFDLDNTPSFSCFPLSLLFVFFFYFSSVGRHHLDLYSFQFSSLCHCPVRYSSMSIQCLSSFILSMPLSCFMSVKRLIAHSIKGVYSCYYYPIKSPITFPKGKTTKQKQKQKTLKYNLLQFPYQFPQLVGQ